MKNTLLRSITYTLILSLIWLTVPHTQAAAGNLNTLSDTMLRLKKSTNSSHTIKFTTSVAINQAGDTIVITFPADFNLTSAVYSEVTMTHGASTGAETTEVIHNAADAVKWLAAFSGTQSRILTLTAPTDGVGAAAVAANDKIIITIAATHAVNATTAGSYTITIAVAGANTASGKIGVVIVDDDQVAVSATVDPTLTFSINDVAIGFGSFVGTAIRYATADATGSASEPGNGAPVVLTASTNGIGGWAITIRDQGSGSAAGLYSSVLSELIPAVADTDVSVGGKEYGVYGKNPGSGVTVDECFDNDTNATCSVTTTTADAAIHHTEARRLAYTSAPSAAVAVDLTLKAAIDATTKAGQYTDTITIICTGNY